MVSPCVEAGVWGENVRLGLRGCGARPSRGFAGHDIVATSPEPAGIRLVVGTKLHTWREHSAEQGTQQEPKSDAVAYPENTGWR